MAKLTASQRNNLPSSDFAEPALRKFPVNDASHARNALSRAAQSGSPVIESKVKAKVHSKFPAIGKKLGDLISKGRTKMPHDDMPAKMDAEPDMSDAADMGKAPGPMGAPQTAGFKPFHSAQFKKMASRKKSGYSTL